MNDLIKYLVSHLGILMKKIVFQILGNAFIWKQTCNEFTPLSSFVEVWLQL